MAKETSDKMRIGISVIIKGAFCRLPWTGDCREVNSFSRPPRRGRTLSIAPSFFPEALPTDVIIAWELLRLILMIISHRIRLFRYNRVRLLVVPETGIEPVWGCPRGILSPLRLPIPPLRRPLTLQKTCKKRQLKNQGRVAPIQPTVIPDRRSRCVAETQ